MISLLLVHTSARFYQPTTLYPRARACVDVDSIMNIKGCARAAIDDMNSMCEMFAMHTRPVVHGARARFRSSISDRFPR